MQIKRKNSHRKIGKASRKVTKMKRLRRLHRKRMPRK